MIVTTNTLPASVNYPSRTGGTPHTVTLTVSKRSGIAGPAGTLYVSCDCAGGRNAWANFRLGRNSTCWAMKDAAIRYRAFNPDPTAHAPALPRTRNVAHRVYYVRAASKESAIAYYREDTSDLQSTIVSVVGIGGGLFEVTI